MRRSHRLTPLLAIVTLIAACDLPGSTDTDDDMSAVAGTWVLQSANGESLPFTDYEDSEVREEISGASLVLETDGDATLGVQLTVTDKTTQEVSQPTESATGSYTVDGNTLTITLQWPDDTTPDVISATLDGDNLTLHSEGDDFLFSRV